jgi:CubicO group peptidase (beta-lactamase class C family)
MRRVTTLIGAGLLWAAQALGAWAQTEAPPPSTLDRARVEAFMSGAVRQALLDDRIVGASASVVDLNGLVMARSYGRAGADRAADADTMFRIGSISKTFTWIAIMQLVEAGELTLDDPVNAHLPEALQIPDEGFDEPILIRHLMTHSAGFEDSALGHLFTNRPERTSSLQDYLVRYRVHRVRPPGALSVYSNYGAALAGAIVEHESDMDWPTYAETRILRPLGMATATYREIYSPEIAASNGLPAPASADAAARISDGFRMEAGRMAPAQFEYIIQIGPAGGMSASAAEMARYMHALLDPKIMAAAGVLREETARALNTVIFVNDDRLGAWRHGFMSFDLGDGRWAFGHGGDTIYQHSEMLVSRELGVGVFVTINSAAQTRAPASIAEAFFAEFFPASAPARAEIAATESAQYAGTYLGLRRPFVHTERALFGIIGGIEVAAAEDGDIIVAAGGDARRFYPLGDGLYRSFDGQSRIAFRNVDGQMRLFDAYGLGPADRIGFFKSANWLGLIGLLGLVLALWGVVAGIRRAIARKESLGALSFDVLCLVWLIAFVILIAALAPWLGPDQGAVLFDYPGQLFPIACWLLAAAAAATPIALLAALTIARPKDWSWLRWVRAGACIAVFGALAVTLWDWGLLGFSGF